MTTSVWYAVISIKDKTMGLIRVFLLFSLLFVYAEAKLDIYQQAAKCPHRFHMGCMLDVVEKGCYAVKFMKACANKGKCKKSKSELQVLISALNPKTFEALHRCCCTTAYRGGGYENCKKPDATCKKALAKHVDKNLAKHLTLLKKCFKKASKSTCGKALRSAKWVCITQYIFCFRSLSKYSDVFPVWSPVSSISILFPTCYQAT